MESLFFLIPLSILLLMGGVAVYFWAVKSGQYDDLEREGERILFDDDLPPAPPAPTAKDDNKRSEDGE